MVPRSWGWFKMLLSSSSFVFKRIDPFSLCRLFILNFLFKTRLGIDRVQSSLLTSDVRWRLYEGCHQRRLKLRLWFFFYEFREGNEETCSDPLPRRRTGFGASIMITLLLILENPTCPITGPRSHKCTTLCEIPTRPYPYTYFFLYSCAHGNGTDDMSKWVI